MSTYTSQVGPLTGIDFSKIRKFSKGSKIPKYQIPAQPLPSYDWFKSLYQQQSLDGWNEGQSTAKWGNTPNAELHGHADDLQIAFQAYLNYIRGNQIGNDIQTYYNTLNTDNNLTAEDFVTRYNNGIGTLNGFWQNQHTYGQTGIAAYNQLFNKMYQSRGIGTDIGYNQDLEDIMGSQTWLRRTDQYNKEYDELTDEEKKARTFEITVGDNKKVKVFKKADGTIGLLPEETPAQDGSGISITNTNQNNGGGSSTKITTENDLNKDGGSSTNTNNNSWQTNTWQPATFQGDMKYTPTPWTDWAHLESIRGHNERAINNYYDILNSTSPALETANQIYGKSTSNYAQQQANLKQADAMAANVARNGTSSATTNNAMMAQARAAQQQVYDQNTTLMEQAAEKSRANAEGIERYNGAQRVDNTNENNSIIAADSQRKANNNAMRMQELNTNETDAENKEDESHNKWVGANRNIMAQKAYDHNTLAYNKWLLKYKDAYTNAVDQGSDSYAEALAEEYLNSPQEFELTEAEQTMFSGVQDPQKIAEYIKTHPESNLGKIATKRYADAVNAAEKRYTQAKQAGQVYLAEINSMIDRYNTGDGILNTKINAASLWDDNAPALSFKKGGNIKALEYQRKVEKDSADRMYKYLEHNRKVRKDLSDRAQKESDRSTRYLQSRLDALNRETLMLLRSIFS